MNKSVELEAARRTLDKYPRAKTVPRMRYSWGEYLKYLRQNVLGLTQVIFWGMFDVEKGTGSKYERLSSDPSLFRLVPEQLMLRIMSELNLHWAADNRYGQVDGVNNVIRLTDEGMEIFSMISSSDITPKDLRVLLDLHKYYRSK